jgi:hypothetical protein
MNGNARIAVGACTTIVSKTAIYILRVSPLGTVYSSNKILASSLGITVIIYFAFSVSAPGDVDGDGNSDLVVGSYCDDDGATDAGAVWVLYLNGDGTLRSYSKISRLAGGFSGSPGVSDLSSHLTATDYFGDPITPHAPCPIPNLLAPTPTLHHSPQSLTTNSQSSPPTLTPRGVRVVSRRCGWRWAA